MAKQRSPRRKERPILPEPSQSERRKRRPPPARPAAGFVDRPAGAGGAVEDAPAAHASTRGSREVSFAVLRAQEDERLRIARDLHDGVGQILGAAKLEIDRLALAARARESITEADLLAVSARIADAYSEVRAIATALRPPALERVGLEPALRTLVAEFGKRTGTRATFEDRGAGPRLAPEVEINLYRIAQEALANVAKHAAARSVRVALVRRPGSVELTIEDDGRGFARPRSAGLGLAGIRERAGLLGGEARIVSRRGEGTRVEVVVPGGCAGAARRDARRR